MAPAEPQIASVTIHSAQYFGMGLCVVRVDAIARAYSMPVRYA